jgi:RimJ/RimL family protein N-acetyltransferase
MDWEVPGRITRQGQYVSLAPLDPERDIDDLYELSHEPPSYQAVWTYLWNGPFASKAEMLTWLGTVAASDDPLFFTVTSHAHDRKVGMIAIMNIVASMGRAELGSIWYSPLVQRTKVNTETTFLLLSYLFDDLGYRRVEWKCHNENQRSKQTAQRMGFVHEGLFRQHMIVKGKNRDTAWFSIIDSEWPTRKANFQTYLAADTGVSLAALNGFTPPGTV